MQPELIGGRYRVEAVIGRGGMGEVWLARDETLARQVAVKQVGLLPGESVTDSARALREARSTAALSHRNVVTVFDAVEEDGSIWLVMEHVPSRSLSAIIGDEGALDPARVAWIGAQVADGLAAAHGAGITHRDVKPGNVLVREDGVAKISDFGIARTAGDPALTQSGLFIGTPTYFSPELARGDEPGPAADVWALGATLYAAVEGRPPYELSPNHLAVLNSIIEADPPPLERAGSLEPVISRMLDRDPASRWSMADAAHALNRLADRHRDRTRAATTSAFARPPATAHRDRDRDKARAGSRAAGAAGAAAAAAGAAGTAAAQGAAGPGTGHGNTNGDAARAGTGGSGTAAWGRDDRPGPVDPPPQRPAPAPAPRDRSRRSRGPLVALGVFLALLALAGVVYLTIGDAQDDPSTAADPPAASRQPGGSEQPAEGSGDSGTNGDQGKPQGDPTSFIQDYYSTVPEDTDTGWSMLGPGMKSVGRDSYEGWWGSVSDVAVSDIDAAPSGESADVTLRYTMEDGRVETERQRLDLVESPDGGYLINGEERIG